MSRKKGEASRRLTYTGKKPRYAIPKDDLPKPTEALKMRTEDLGIEKNLNKTMIVQTSTTGTGPRGAGFYVSYSEKGK
jgi:U4/U6.U5 tri-snRNP component SNU23